MRVRDRLIHQRVIIVGILLLSGATKVSADTPFRQHPRLLADSADIVTAREWIQAYPWYREIYERNRDRIDRFIAHRPIHVSPIKQTYRYKMYTCPRHNVELLYEEFRPFDHRCPSDTLEVYRGEPYDMAWAGWSNRRLASQLVWMGILYQVYGDERYASAGKEILLKFADLYLSYPTENTILGPAHVFFGTLSESFWGVDMAYGYDLLFDYPGFSEEDRSHLKKDLFYPLAAITQLFPESASNRQLWYNNVSAAVGFLFGDTSLTDFALSGRYGFEWQLGSALPESGFWAEWSGYHFVALRAMIHLAEMGRHNGLDLYNLAIAGRSMKKMFDAPFDLLLPNYEFPRSKDSGGGSILEYATYYEVGYAVYRDPRYAALLTRTTLGRGKQVVGEESGARETEVPITLFMIAPEIPRTETEIIPEHSIDVTGNGFAILRNGSGKDRQYLYLDYGIMGGEHGHPDRLQIGYFAKGRNWIVDPLNESYFNPNLQLWYRQTIAHNTPVVDQTSQSWANGQREFFGSNPSFQVASGSSEDIYPGSALARTVIMTDRYVIDVCTIKGSDQRILDWPLHSAGSLAVEGVGLRPEPIDRFGHPPGIPGYDQLKGVQSGRTDGAWRAVFTDSTGVGMCVFAAPGKGTEVFRAFSPPLGGFYKQMVTDRRPLPMIISRRRASSTQFVHLFHVFRNAPTVSEFNQEEGNSYRIRHADGEDRIVGDPKTKSLSMIRRLAGNVTLVSGFGVTDISDRGTRLLQSVSRLERIECVWKGDTAHIILPSSFVGIRLRAPGIRYLYLNGSPAQFRREGAEIVFENTTDPCVEIVSPNGSPVYLGEPAGVELRIWNPTSLPVESTIRLQFSPDWRERVRSQVEWWGGVTNLLPLHKYSWERRVYPASLDTERDWLSEVHQVVLSLPPHADTVLHLPFRIPNEIPSVRYPVIVTVGSRSFQSELDVRPPLIASISIPNGPASTLSIDVANSLGHAVDVRLTLSPSPEWKIRGSIPSNLHLAPGERKRINVPISLAGYRAAEQRYPMRLRLSTGGFRREFERDFYAGTVRRADRPPALDGTWEGWDTNDPMTIDSIWQASRLLLGNQPWHGKNDLSAKIYAMYDSKYLYIGADVRDDSVVTTWDFPAMSYPWDTDCMEVVLDERTGSDQGTDPPTPGLRRHLAMPEYRTTSFGPERWQGAGAGGPLLPAPLLVSGAESFFSPTSRGYALITRFPLERLDGEFTRAGGTIGFDVAINDNDGTTYRKNTHLWAGYTRNQTWWDIRTIGRLFFLPRGNR